MRLADPGGRCELLERYRHELAEGDPIELVLETARAGEAGELTRTLGRLGFGLPGAARVVSRETGDDPAATVATEEALLRADSLLDEARSLATILGPVDLALLTRLAGVSTLAIGGDRASVATLRAAAAAGGAALVARALPPRLAREESEQRPPAFDGSERAARPSFAYLDPDHDRSSGWLVALANVLPTGGLVAVPGTVRGTALVRNALASGLFVLHERADRLVVLRRVAGSTVRPAVPVAERAAADDAATRRLVHAAAGRDWNCVDVGASRGDLLRLFVEAAPEGAHHAIEPLPHHAASLRLGFPRVVVHELALSDRSGRSSFVHVHAADAYSGILPRPGSPEGGVTVIAVETARLDDVLPEGYVPSLVKIDTEGGEGRVIAGGIDTLRRHRPLVLFEHGLPASLSYGIASCDLWDALCGECGLEIYSLDGRGPYSRSAFSCPKARWNFVAVPPGLCDIVAASLGAPEPEEHVRT